MPLNCHLQRSHPDSPDFKRVDNEFVIMATSQTLDCLLPISDRVRMGNTLCGSRHLSAVLAALIRTEVDGLEIHSDGAQEILLSETYDVLERVVKDILIKEINPVLGPLPTPSVDQVKELAQEYLRTFSGDDCAAKNIRLHASIKQLLNNKLTNEHYKALEYLAGALEYRMRSMRLASAYKNHLGLPYPDCEAISLGLFLYDTREHSRNWARGVEFDIPVVFRLFDRPCGSWCQGTRRGRGIRSSA